MNDNYNLLERSDNGEIFIDGENLLNLISEELRLRRQKIGMIFQYFNLLEQQTVLNNVCFPLEIRGISRRERREKAMELLDKVGLTEKAGAYPSQLSGGQKQSVVIARVLANDPEILLCDEATSALDPETTKTILGLLKTIHDTMGITIVIITHEIRVIQEICPVFDSIDRCNAINKASCGKKLWLNSNHCSPDTGSRTIGLLGSAITHFEIPAAKHLVSVYMQLFRNTPLLVQLFFIYFALPKIGISVSPEACGTWGLGLLGGAYMTETFRSGLENIPRIQSESAESLP